MPRWQFDICTTPRIELRRDGKTYCSSNDLTAALTVDKNETSAGGRLRFRRLFNPVGGFQSVVLTLPAEHPFTVTLKIGDEE